MLFETVIQEALQSDHVILTDSTKEKLTAQVDCRAFMVVSDSYELSPSLRREDGKYDHNFLSFSRPKGNVFDTILSEPKNLKSDPSFIGVFDWQNGNLSKQDINPLVRCDIAFAIVFGAGIEKDSDALDQLFHGAQFFPVIIVC